ncbi:MAG: nucleotidyltransferase family protein [Planctomycetes bacterium]|nr:nucleotidyltransferase family protein [Planctomycetota bacterium]
MAELNLYDELLALVDALEKHRVEYAICGGLALGILGHPRMTKDIDILVREEDLQKATEVVNTCGFTVPSGRIPFRLGQPDEQVLFRLNKVVGRRLLTLDLMIVPPFLEDVWVGRNTVQWQGRTVKIVSREGLVRMKRLAGRRQDLADLEKLEAPIDETKPSP